MSTVSVGSTHDGSQGDELDELAGLTDHCLQLGVGEHPSELIEQGGAGDQVVLARQGGIEHGAGCATPSRYRHDGVGVEYRTDHDTETPSHPHRPTAPGGCAMHTPA
jgi:hypothetical protein